MIIFAALPILLLLIAATNFFLIRSPKSTSALQEKIAVIVPMRNEAENVEGLIENLALQLDVSHFYILDDNSEDSTYELLQRFTKDKSGFTLIKGAPLTDGWIGKTWALQQLFDSTHEEFLVSIDADVRLSNGAINQAVTLLKHSGLDFISPYPQQIARSFGERLIQPLLQWSWMTTVPLRIAERSRQTSMTVANGQFFVVRRNALEKIGGYKSVKDAVIDDVFLARELVKCGASGTVVNGAAIAQTRMYSRWSEIEAGYGKSLSKAFGSLFGAIFVIIFLFMSGIAPLVLGIAGDKYGWIGYVAIVLTRILSAVKSRSRLIDSVLHPISAAALIYLIIYSYLMRGNITWKGRTV